MFAVLNLQTSRFFYLPYLRMLSPLVTGIISLSYENISLSYEIISEGYEIISEGYEIISEGYENIFRRYSPVIVLYIS